MQTSSYIKSHKQALIRALMEWYRAHQRELPWRGSRDPYRIWLSEIILQQTRVDQGLAYYLRLLEQYPNVASLAASSEDELLKHWQGLGYYSRARNLLRTARLVAHEYGGLFPQTRDGLLQLPGIGPYTAGAIASIAYSEAVPAVDGNVQRVLSRLLCLAEPVDSTGGKQKLETIAGELLYREDPGSYNQALMEFGALHCLPSQPLCTSCPLVHFCMAKQAGMEKYLPVKKTRMKQRVRHFHYLCIQLPEGYLLRKREEKDIWLGLYEPPLLETKKSCSLQALMKLPEWKSLFGKTSVTLRGSHGPVRHQLSHQQIHAVFYELRMEPPAPAMLDHFLRVPGNELNRYPVPVLIERFLAEGLQK